MMDFSSKVACNSSLSYSTLDGAAEAMATATGAQAPSDQDPVRRRRHSSFARPRRKSLVNHIMDSEEGLLLKVRFLLTRQCVYVCCAAWWLTVSV